MVGTYLLKGLAEMKKRIAYIGDVRGKGLMIGIEMMENEDKMTPMSPKKFGIFFEKCREMGLLIGVGGYDKNV